MGKNAYDKSNRQKTKTLDNVDRQGTSYRRIQELRRIWTKYRQDWIKMKKPEKFPVIIYDDNEEEKEVLNFKTQLRGDGFYLILCDEFTWVD